MNKALQLWDAFLTYLVRLPRISLGTKGLTKSLPLRVSVKEQIIFFKRLSMMLRAQMPIVTAL